MPALHGRPFNRQADAATGEPLVVLAESAWRKYFGADPQTVGRRARLNGVPHTVVGVMPGGFRYPASAELWLLSSKPVPLPPIDVSGDLLEARDVQYFNAVGRLAPGVTLTQAASDLGALAAEVVALGARPGQVMGPVVREGMALGFAGVVIGLAGAFAATKVLSAFLFGVRATDPVTFAGVAALLLAVAFIASYIPSRRALRVDPITALRAD